MQLAKNQQLPKTTVGKRTSFKPLFFKRWNFYIGNRWYSWYSSIMVGLVGWDFMNLIDLVAQRQFMVVEATDKFHFSISQSPSMLQNLFYPSLNLTMNLETRFPRNKTNTNNFKSIVFNYCMCVDFGRYRWFKIVQNIDSYECKTCTPVPMDSINTRND